MKRNEINGIVGNSHRGMNNLRLCDMNQQLLNDRNIVFIPSFVVNILA